MASSSSSGGADAPTLPIVGLEVPPSAKRRKVETKSNDGPLFKYIDDHQEEFVQKLAEFVAIPGVSAEPARRGEVRRAVEWARAWCDRLGAATRLEELGEQTLPNGTTLPLPPVLLAQFGDDPSKRTLVLYGHLDVQPAAKSDGWDTEPFVLTEKNGALYGRGASDDKGPVVAWLSVIQSMQALGMEMPINLRCIFEGMEESGSVGLPDLVRRLGTPGGFLDPGVCDFVSISDNYWTGKSKPCLTHGLRGCVYFHLDVQCSTKDMHSGVIGGSVHEAMTDVVRIMSTLVDSQGRILVDGISENVMPVTEEEMKSYEQVEFDIESYKADAGVAGVTDTLLHASKNEILMHRWRFPTLSLHGIEGAFDGAGSKTVIPRRVVGKFSLRIVPNMQPEEVEAKVRRHVESQWKLLKSPNKWTLKVDKASFPWYRDHNVPNFRAAAAATRRVHGMDPCLTREGGSIPITQVFEEVCEASCVLLPIGASDDGAHSQNEKIDRINFTNGMKLLGCYIDELARLPARQDAAARAAAAHAAASRMASNRWRRRCRKNQAMYGCDCLDCF